MYLEQTCRIEFLTKEGVKYTIRGLHSYEGKKSVHQTVQSCKLELPVSVLIRNNDQVSVIEPLSKRIKEGDKITIYLGYNGNNKKEFEGYIKRINQKMPLELECEDDLYLLRKIRLKKSFKKAQVTEVLKYILDELYKQQGLRLELYTDIPKTEVFNFWMDQANGVTVLQELEDKYLLRSFLTEINGKKVLYCGLTYGLKKKRVKYIFNRNVISIDDLKYFNKNDRSFKITIRHVKADGTEKKYEFGDPKGDNHEMMIQAPMSEAGIKQYAMGILEGLQTGSYKGSFQTFLIPHVEPCDIADVEDRQFIQRGGSYYVSGVTTTFGSGARRSPEIEIRI